MKVITFGNQKGGTGKTTLANLIGTGLIERGYKTLFIDLDAQQNLTFCMNGLTDGKTSLDVLTGTPIEEAIKHTQQGDLVPASNFLANITAEDIQPTALKEALKPIKNKYDYVIVDTPPALSMLTVNSLIASDQVIIPARTDGFSLQGISQLAETLKAIKQVNKGIKIAGIVITQYNGRGTVYKAMAENLKAMAESLDTKVFNTPLRNCISITEAQIMQQSLFKYAPKSNAYKDINLIIDEMIGG